MQRFLQAQNIVNLKAYMAVGVFLLHMLRSWLVVYFLGYGLLREALTLSFSWWILVLLNGLYILFSPTCKETWIGFTVKAFIGIWPYFKFTVASAVMVWYDYILNFTPVVLFQSLLLFHNMHKNLMTLYSTSKNIMSENHASLHSVIYMHTYTLNSHCYFKKLFLKFRPVYFDK